MPKPSKSDVGLFLASVLAGAAVKVLWEVGQLPGYGKIVAPLGQMVVSPNDKVYLGEDDSIELGIGAALAAGGYAKKSRGLEVAGLGFDSGVLAAKMTEFFVQGGLYQILFGNLPPAPSSTSYHIVAWRT